ncbi:hypothetical protein BDK51DRAFT_31854, partial [Blyttiomyces helicus]
LAAEGLQANSASGSAADSSANTASPNAFSCFWTFLSYPSLRFLHIPTLLQNKISQGDLQPDSILTRSLFEFLHPADAQLIRRDFQCFMDLRTLQGSIIRCRIKNLFAMGNSTSVDSRNAGEANDEYVLADVGLNAINHECVLAFFHVGRVPTAPACASQFKGEINRWDAKIVADLNAELFNALELANARSDAYDHVTPHGINSHATLASRSRIVQVFDAEDMSLLFVYPKERLSALISVDASEISHVPNFQAKYFHPEDYERFQGELTRIAERKTAGAVAGRGIGDGWGLHCEAPEPVHNCTSGLFYMQHRLCKANASAADVSQRSYVQVESVVVPYGKVMFVCTQALIPHSVEGHAPGLSSASWATGPRMHPTAERAPLDCPAIPAHKRAIMLAGRDAKPDSVEKPAVPVATVPTPEAPTSAEPPSDSYAQSQHPLPRAPTSLPATVAPAPASSVSIAAAGTDPSSMYGEEIPATYTSVTYNSPIDSSLFPPQVNPPARETEYQNASFHASPSRALPIKQEPTSGGMHGAMRVPRGSPYSLSATSPWVTPSAYDSYRGLPSPNTTGTIYTDLYGPAPPSGTQSHYIHRPRSPGPQMVLHQSYAAVRPFYRDHPLPHDASQIPRSAYPARD